MEIDEVIRLIDAVAGRDIAEFSIEREGLSLKIVRGAGAAVQPLPPQVEAREPEAQPRRAQPDDKQMHTVASPMVGTFYAAPGPSAEPYVKVGDFVKKGQILCIVEAMKLMNEIESDVTGTAVEVLVENGSPVEFGEGLFKLIVED